MLGMTGASPALAFDPNPLALAWLRAGAGMVRSSPYASGGLALQARLPARLRLQAEADLGSVRGSTVSSLLATAGVVVWQRQLTGTILGETGRQLGPIKDIWWGRSARAWRHREVLLDVGLGRMAAPLADLASPWLVAGVRYLDLARLPVPRSTLRHLDVTSLHLLVDGPSGRVGWFARTAFFVHTAPGWNLELHGGVLPRGDLLVGVAALWLAP